MACSLAVRASSLDVEVASVLGTPVPVVDPIDGDSVRSQAATSRTVAKVAAKTNSART